MKVTALVVLTMALAGGPNYVKWQEAKKLAAQTGRPIIVYATVNEEGGSC